MATEQLSGQLMSELPTTVINGAEEIPCEKAGANHKVTTQQLKDFAQEGVATETFVTTKIAEAQLGGGGEVDTSGFATKTELNQKADKSAIPTKTSQLQNDSNFVKDAAYVHTDNNFTQAEKEKLAGITPGSGGGTAGPADVVTEDWEQGDLAIKDGVGNTLAQFAGGHIKTRNFDSRDVNKGKTLKVLIMGNSYACDAFSYVPYVLQEILPDVDFELVLMVKNGYSIQQHYNDIKSDVTYGLKHWWGKKSQTWGSLGDDTFKNVIKKPWDIICFHTDPNGAADYLTYQPYLNDTIKYIYANSAHPTKIGWMITPALANGRSDMQDTTSDAFFAKECEAAKKVMTETAVEIMFPAGTAIQNARSIASLNELGATGQLCHDQLHLQEGLPRLIEAYANAITLLDFIGEKNKSILGNKIRPTQDNITKWANPQQHGTSVGVTDENCWLAQRCAIIAANNPLVKTDCSKI